MIDLDFQNCFGKKEGETQHMIMIMNNYYDIDSV